jgi:heme O synthase-like polyprenyltransferase
VKAKLSNQAESSENQDDVILEMKKASQDSSTSDQKKSPKTGQTQVVSSDEQWREQRINYSKLPQFYSKLSKRNLSSLVVATTMMGCGMAPVPFDPYIFMYTVIGTGLTSTSANTFNQVNLKS